MTESSQNNGPSDGVANHFNFGDHLGEGGMAKVYTARDSKLQRTVALKLLRPELENESDHRERFFQEARILADIDHPGTIPVFEAGMLPDGNSFYSMQKIAGETLQKLLENRNKEEILSRHRTVHFIDIFERVCQTVAYAHQRGIVHRDLKPENIMVGELGQVFVIDWGIAKKLPTEELVGDSMTVVGSVMGTPAYMSPEQADGYGHESDERTDVFSLGIILYEILTGKQPFQAKTNREALSKVRYHDPDPPAKLYKRINRSLSAVCMKCLHKDPFQRYPSATELALDVRRYLEHQPVSACKPRLVERILNWSWRRPALASTLGTLALLVLLTFFGIAFQASLEHHKVSEAYEIIDLLKAERKAIAEQVAQLSESFSGTQNTLAIQEQLIRLSARDQVLHDLIRGTAWGIMGLTIYTSDKRPSIILRELFQEKIDSLLDQDRTIMAQTYLDALKELKRERSIFGYLRADRDWVEEYLEKLREEQ